MNPNDKQYNDLIADMIRRDEQRKKMLMAELLQKPVQVIETDRMKLGFCVN